MWRYRRNVNSATEFSSFAFSNHIDQMGSKASRTSKNNQIHPNEDVENEDPDTYGTQIYQDSRPYSSVRYGPPPLYVATGVPVNPTYPTYDYMMNSRFHPTYTEQSYSPQPSTSSRLSSVQGGDRVTPIEDFQPANSRTKGAAAPSFKRISNQKGGRMKKNVRVTAPEDVHQSPEPEPGTDIDQPTGENFQHLKKWQKTFKPKDPDRESLDAVAFGSVDASNETVPRQLTNSGKRWYEENYEEGISPYLP